EASFVARTVERLLGGASFHSLDSGRVDATEPGEQGGGGLGFSDFAVLYRTDRQARALAEAFTRTGLPFQKRSHDRLADRPGVAPLVAAMSGDGPVTALLGRAVDDLLRRGAPESTPESTPES